MELEGSPYFYLFDDPEFTRWFKNLKRGRVSTAHEWFRRMGRLHKRFGKSPKEIAAMNPKEAANFIMDVITALEEEGMSGSYVANMVKPVKNWLSFNGVEVLQRIKISNRSKVTTVGEEKTPTQEELKKIFGMADFRAKVACALLAFGGFRIETLGDYLGKDGLKVKDFPELTIKDGVVEFEKIPTLVIVRDNLSKARHQYFTFIADEGCGYLKEYLEWRLRSGQKLESNSPIITPKTDFVGKHISTTNISDIMRKAIRSAGFGWRPYVLRSYFDTRMMIAEMDRLIIRDWRVFWMGHTGDIEHTYTLNKRLPDEVIDRMREAYAKASEKCLVTERRQAIGQDMVRAQFNRQFLEIAGYSEEELEGMDDLSALTSADITKLIQEKSKKALGLNGNSQKVVPIEEVKTRIAEGWEFVRDLPPNDAIIKLPH